VGLVQSWPAGPEATSTTAGAFRCLGLAPTVTWGHHPARGIRIDEPCRPPSKLEPNERPLAEQALLYMDLTPGGCDAGSTCGCLLIGSCTRRSLSDLRAAAAVGRSERVAGESRFCVPAL